MTDDQFRRILEHFQRPWKGYRKVRKGVKKKLSKHMEEPAAVKMDDYLHILDTDAEARKEAEKRLTVTISRFFRDRKLWEDLEQHAFPALLRNWPGSVRVWSAGCAGGEEPYSVAIVWDHTFSGGPNSPALSILGTDSNPEVLARAQKGVYSASSLKDMPEALKEQYFDAGTNARRFKLVDRIKDYVTWERRDLVRDDPPKRTFHLVFLRNNLLTYFEPHLLAWALPRIVDTIVAEGFLVIGSQESMPRIDLPLERADFSKMFYRKVIVYQSGTGVEVGNMD